MCGGKEPHELDNHECGKCPKNKNAKCVPTGKQVCSCGMPQSYPIPHEHDQTEREKAIIAHYETQEAKLKEPKSPHVKKVWVGVEVFQLIVQDVHLFADFEAAKKWFKEYTGYYWPGLEGEAGWDEHFDQTKIFELEVPG